MLVCTYACTWYGEGVHWPLSDGLFPPKWRHKGSGVGNGVGLCVYVYVCVCALKKRGRGFLECVEMSFALPSNYVLLFHLPLLSSSPIPHPFSSFFLLALILLQLPAEPQVVVISVCPAALTVYTQKWELAPQTAQPHLHAHACRDSTNTKTCVLVLLKTVFWNILFKGPVGMIKENLLAEMKYTVVLIMGCSLA